MLFIWSRGESLEAMMYLNRRCGVHLQLRISQLIGMIFSFTSGKTKSIPATSLPTPSSPSASNSTSPNHKPEASTGSSPLNPSSSPATSPKFFPGCASVSSKTQTTTSTAATTTHRKSCSSTPSPKTGAPKQPLASKARISSMF